MTGLANLSKWTVSQDLGEITKENNSRATKNRKIWRTMISKGDDIKKKVLINKISFR